MSKIVKVGLLSLLAIVQVLIIVSGAIAYQQMMEMLGESRGAYSDLVFETTGIQIDMMKWDTPNLFAPLFLLALLGLFLTLVLLVDEVRHKNAGN